MISIEDLLNNSNLTVEAVDEVTEAVEENGVEELVGSNQEQKNDIKELVSSNQEQDKLVKNDKVDINKESTTAVEEENVIEQVYPQNDPFLKNIDYEWVDDPKGKGFYVQKKNKGSKEKKVSYYYLAPSILEKNKIKITNFMYLGAGSYVIKTEKAVIFDTCTGYYPAFIVTSDNEIHRIKHTQKGIEMILSLIKG